MYYLQSTLKVYMFYYIHITCVENESEYYERGFRYFEVTIMELTTSHKIQLKLNCALDYFSFNSWIFKIIRSSLYKMKVFHFNVENCHK